MYPKHKSEVTKAVFGNCCCCCLPDPEGIKLISCSTQQSMEGAQWLSGRVLDSRPKGSGFEPHQRHCVVVLEQGTFILA